MSGQGTPLWKMTFELRHKSCQVKEESWEEEKTTCRKKKVRQICSWPLNKEKESQCGWSRVKEGEVCRGDIGRADKGQMMWGLCGPCKDTQDLL